MKKFSALMVLFSLCLFALGCEPAADTTTPAPSATETDNTMPAEGTTHEEGAATHSEEGAAAHSEEGAAAPAQEDAAAPTEEGQQ